MKTVVGLYDDFNDARDAIEELVDMGFARNDISLVAADRDERYRRSLEGYEGNGDVDDVAGSAAVGAAAGGIVGGMTGLLVSLSALAIPAIGPIVAAGPIVATLTGAGIGVATGGILGALAGWGIPEEEAEYYAEGVRRGGTLVTVSCPEERVNEAASILNKYNPVDVERRSEFWRQTGWTAFDQEDEPYATEDFDRYQTAYTAFFENEFNSYASDFRRHYNTRYAHTGNDYSYYTPAYRYGYVLATDDRYRDYSRWEDLEYDAREGWRDYRVSDDSLWDDIKDSVRYAWMRFRDAVDGDSYDRSYASNMERR